MALNMIASARVKSEYLPDFVTTSGVLYRSYESAVIENVAPGDAQVLLDQGYTFMGIPPIFGHGAPTGIAQEGQNYYDVDAIYAIYVYDGSWKAIPGGGSTEVTSVIAGAGISVNHASGDVTVTNGGVTSIIAGAGVLIDEATGAVTIRAGVPSHGLVAGGAAGTIAVTGIKVGDRLDQVLQYVYVAGVTTDVLDLTAEFAINGTGTINNTGGTNTTGNKLLVNWTKLTS